MILDMSSAISRCVKRVLFLILTRIRIWACYCLRRRIGLVDLRSIVKVARVVFNLRMIFRRLQDGCVSSMLNVGFVNGCWWISRPISLISNEHISMYLWFLTIIIAIILRRSEVRLTMALTISWIWRSWIKVVPHDTFIVDVVILVFFIWIRTQSIPNKQPVLQHKPTSAPGHIWRMTCECIKAAEWKSPSAYSRILP